MIFRDQILPLVSLIAQVLLLTPPVIPLHLLIPPRLVEPFQAHITPSNLEMDRSTLTTPIEEVNLLEAMKE
jgi:hypothetical protein